MLVCKRQIILIFSGLFILISPTYAQQLKSFFPTTNGSISSVVVSGDTLFLSGYFTHLFNEDNTSRHAVILNDSNEQIKGSTDKPNGPVYSSISDGNGGFYIGGLFTKVGDSTRINLAHFNKEGKVTSKVDQRPNGAVYALHMTGTKLFLGGDFGIMGKRYTTRGAILNPLTAGLEMSPNYTFKGTVNCSAPDGRGGWYVGGNFLMVGDSIRYRIAHIDAYGNLYPWAPDLNGAVYTIQVKSNTIYIGGAFDVINGVAVPYFATIDAYDSKLVNQNYFIRPDDAVTTIVIQNDILYLGGYFTRINNSNRNMAAAIELQSGLLRSWNPQINDGYVLSMAICGNSMLLGGSFTRVAGQNRSYCASVNLLAAALQAWNPSPDKRVNVIQVKGGTIYLGGEFNVVNGQTRNFIASLDSASSQPNAWNPSSDGPVYGITCFEDHVYVAGDFTKIGLIKRKYLADIRADNGTLFPWDAIPDASVRTVTYSGLRLFAGGDFFYIGGVVRNNIACIDIKNDNIDLTWKADLDGAVYALCAHPEKGLLYAGGGFKIVNGFNRNFLSAFSTLDAGLSAFDPQCDDTVFALNRNDSFLFAGGKFDHIGINGRSKLARFSLYTGLLNTPVYNASGVIYAIQPVANSIIIGGMFNQLNGFTRSNIGKLDYRTGSVLNWNQEGTNGVVRALHVDSNFVYVGGGFTIGGAEFVNHICRFGITDGLVKPWPVYLNNDVFTFSKSETGIFTGGTFTIAGGVNRNYFAAINSTWGDILPIQLKLNGIVKQMYVGNGKLLVSGLFNKVGTVNRRNLAAFSISDLRLLPLDIQVVSGEIRSMFLKDSLLFIGGNFDSLNGTAASRFACLNFNTGNIVQGLPSVNGIVNALVADTNYLYAGGTFSNIGGQYFTNLFRLKLSNRKPDSSWVSNVIGNGINVLNLSDTLLYVGGNFSHVGNSNRTNIADVSLKTGNAKSLNVDMYSEAFSIAKVNRVFLTGGGYDLLWSTLKDYFFATNLSNSSVMYSWGFLPNNNVSTLATRNGIIYHGGDFTYPKNYLAVTDTSVFPCTSNLAIRAGGPTSICNGDSVLLSFTPSPYTSYQWQINGNRISNSLDTLIQAKSTGAYSVRIVDSSRACITESSNIKVILNESPFPQSLFVNDTLFICNGDSTIAGIEPAIGFTYQWYRNDVKLNADTTNKKRIGDEAKYSLYVVNRNGCPTWMKPLQTTLKTAPQKPIITGKFAPVKTSTILYTTSNGLGLNTYWSIQGGIIQGKGIGDTLQVKWPSLNDKASISAVFLSPIGCKSDTTTIQVDVGDSLIQLSDTVFWIASYGKNLKIGIRSNLDWGALAIGTNWITISPTFGSDNDSVQIQVASNRSLNQRSGKVAVYSQLIEKYLTINQYPAIDSLKFVSDTLIFDSKAHLDSVFVLSNAKWDITNTATWVTFQNATDSGRAMVHFSLNANLNASPRSTTVSISTGLVSSHLYIYQFGNTGFVERPIQSTCKIYPIPAKNYLYIDDCFDISIPLQLFDITGKLIGEFKIDSERSKIILPSLTKGFYYLKSCDGKNCYKIFIGEEG